MKVNIANRNVGEGEPCFIIAEIGINHNGDLNLAKKLIDVAASAGCDAVKFQKRTIEAVYSQEELDKPVESPFGSTYRVLKEGLEFGLDEYREIDSYCQELGIMWFASCWDKSSVDFMDRFNPPCYKIASPSLTNDDLLRHIRSKGKPVILSTGMSTFQQINHAVDILGTEDLVIMHCTSSYPSPPEELNLRVIQTLSQRYSCPVGYSGHEVGISTTIAAAVLGAKIVERHITLDRAMWGSDQAASMEPQGIQRVVTYVRTIEKAMGDGIKVVYPSEREKIYRHRLKRVV
ncbi:MAG: N-acetylneuraminate synthase family protein [Dehalococcoidales bacterium]|nr:N-acetylneuraminate synthase family protein [Dehalococcoidales bacterium]